MAAETANIKDKNSYVYFLYSDQQNKDRTNIEKKMSRTFHLGVVIVNGKKKFFTEMSKKNTNRYPDCKVVAEGLKTKMVYTATYSS